MRRALALLSALVAAATAFEGARLGPGSSELTDKARPRVQCFASEACFAVFEDAQLGALYAARSSDLGLTWGEPSLLGEVGTRAKLSCVSRAAQAERCTVVWTRRETADTYTLHWTSSEDGGATWATSGTQSFTSQSLSTDVSCFRAGDGAVECIMTAVTENEALALRVSGVGGGTIRQPVQLVDPLAARLVIKQAAVSCEDGGACVVVATGSPTETDGVEIHMAVLVRSMDGGASWSAPGPIAPSATHDAAFSTALQVDSGASMYTEDPDISCKGTTCVLSVTVGVLQATMNTAWIESLRSTNGGETWTSLKAMATRVQGMVLAKPSVACEDGVAGVGRCAAAWETAAGTPVFAESADMGETWTAPQAFDVSGVEIAGSSLIGADLDVSCQADMGCVAIWIARNLEASPRAAVVVTSTLGIKQPAADAPDGPPASSPSRSAAPSMPPAIGAPDGSGGADEGVDDGGSNAGILAGIVTGCFLFALVITVLCYRLGRNCAASDEDEEEDPLAALEAARRENLRAARARKGESQMSYGSVKPEPMVPPTASKSLRSRLSRWSRLTFATDASVYTDGSHDSARWSHASSVRSSAPHRSWSSRISAGSRASRESLTRMLYSFTSSRPGSSTAPAAETNESALGRPESLGAPSPSQQEQLQVPDGLQQAPAPEQQAPQPLAGDVGRDGRFQDL